MKKYFLQLFISTLISTSCSSQNEFDLSKIRMPFNAEIILKSDFEYKKDLNFENYIGYKSIDKRLFVFDEINFKKETSNKYWSPTNLKFQLDSINNQISFIRFETNNKNDSEELYISILKKFGKPDYYNKDKKFLNCIWEFDKTIYAFSQNYTTKTGDKNSISSKIQIIKSDDIKLLNYFLFEGFTYYLEYIEFRNKKENKDNISFLDFAKEKKEDFFEGSEKYINEIDGNLPL